MKFKVGERVYFNKTMKAVILVILRTDKVKDRYGIIYESPSGDYRTTFTQKHLLSREPKNNQIIKVDLGDGQNINVNL